MRGLLVISMLCVLEALRLFKNCSYNRVFNSKNQDIHSEFTHFLSC